MSRARHGAKSDESRIVPVTPRDIATCKYLNKTGKQEERQRERIHYLLHSGYVKRMSVMQDRP